MTSHKNPDQDFETVILRKAPDKKTAIKKGNYETKARFNASGNRQNRTDVDLRKIENEQIKLPKVPKEMSLAIQKARATLGLTQEKLATQCALTKEVIRDYENGSAIVRQQELDKLNKGLRLQGPNRLRKPKAEKIVFDTDEKGAGSGSGSGSGRA